MKTFEFFVVLVLLITFFTGISAHVIYGAADEETTSSGYGSVHSILYVHKTDVLPEVEQAMKDDRITEVEYEIISAKNKKLNLQKAKEGIKQLIRELHNQ